MTPRQELAALLVPPVRAGNAFEETVERLLTVIKLGVVPAGERFPAERELASLLGISRITLREAFRALGQAGYVESRRGRFGGTFVTYTRPAPDLDRVARIAREDPDGLADALTFRLAVETGAAEALARSIDDRGRDVLSGRLTDVNQAGPGDYRRKDTLFHLTIAELTGSGLLTTACADARMRLNDLLNAIPVLGHNIEHTALQHTAIAEAIAAGDPEGARRAVTEHLDGTAALLRGFLAAPGDRTAGAPGSGAPGSGSAAPGSGAGGDVAGRAGGGGAGGGRAVTHGAGAHGAGAHGTAGLPRGGA